MAQKGELARARLKSGAALREQEEEGGEEEEAMAWATTEPPPAEAPQMEMEAGSPPKCEMYLFVPAGVGVVRRVVC